MKPRAYTPKDHAMLSFWWEMHQWGAIPQDLLPQTGVIIENASGIPICAGFMYKTDSKFCMLEWVVSDPLSDTIERGEALNLLLDELVSKARDSGFTTMFTSAVNERLAQRYKDHGFQTTDKGVTHFVRRLWQ